MSEINTVSLPCRDMRHAWFRAGDNIIIKDGNRVRHFRRRAECQRCGTVKTEEFKVSYGRNNRVVAVALDRRKYDYVQGYQVTGGLKVADARAILFEGLTFTYEDDQ